LDLFRDILDKQVLDAHKTKCGKVDGLIMRLGSKGTRPRITHIEMGSITLARRLGPRAERWIKAWHERFGSRRSITPYRVEWRKVMDVGVDIELAIDARETPYGRSRDWLRRHVLKYLPGK